MVFSLTEVILEINTTPGAGQPTWTPIKEIVTASVASNNNTETWVPMNSSGFQSALKTSLGKTITCDGRRDVGDPGNDYVMSLDNKVGEAAKTQLRFTFPKKGTEPNRLVYPCSIDVTGILGASPAVSTLSFTATSDKAWTWEVAS